MSQLTIYLDRETQRKIEAAARRESLSVSRWARQHLAQAADVASASAWDHLAAFAGTVDSLDLPDRSALPREVPDLEA